MPAAPGDTHHTRRDESFAQWSSYSYLEHLYDDALAVTLKSPMFCGGLHSVHCSSLF